MAWLSHSQRTDLFLGTIQSGDCIGFANELQTKLD
jgi:hypothetical protein